MTTNANKYTRIPPQARDLEEAVLGAIMLECGVFEVCAERLKAESFYVEANRKIYSAMLSLFLKSMPIDLLTVISELKTRNELDVVGGATYVAKLTNNVVSTASIQAHSLIIVQKYILREIIKIASDVINKGYEDSTDAFELLDHLESSIVSISLENLKNNYKKITNGIVKVLKQIDNQRSLKCGISGIPSGFYRLDKMTNGWQNSDLIIIGARPSVGKTSFALNLARNAALGQLKSTAVGIFSLEMSEQQLIQRLLSAESEIPLEKIRRGELDDADLTKLQSHGVNKIYNASIFIDDSAGLNIFELRNKAKSMKRKHGIGLIIIDYLQLMAGEKNSQNREQEISHISRNLKKLAKDLNLPIIALSQLSRDIEKRGKGQRIPQLSDLRESGAIEQDADIVILLYRPYPDEIEENREFENIGMIKIAKHRNGSIGDIPMNFYGHIQKWTDTDARI